jgi:hypothetical protein
VDTPDPAWQGREVAASNFYGSRDIVLHGAEGYSAPRRQRRRTAEPRRWSTANDPPDNATALARRVETGSATFPTPFEARCKEVEKRF